MTLAELRERPTRYDTGPNGPRFHESIFRSYQCLQKVRELLMKDAPPWLVLEIIDDVMDAPQLTSEQSP